MGDTVLNFACMLMLKEKCKIFVFFPIENRSHTDTLETTKTDISGFSVLQQPRNVIRLSLLQFTYRSVFLGAIWTNVIPNVVPEKRIKQRKGRPVIVQGGNFRKF